MKRPKKESDRESTSLHRVGFFNNKITPLAEQSPIHALHQAAAHGHIQEVRELIEKGVDVDAVLPGDDECTGLFFACLHGRVCMVHYLIERCGANPYEVSKHEKLAIQVAAQNNQEEVFVYLYQLLRKSELSIDRQRHILQQVLTSIIQSDLYDLLQGFVYNKIINFCEDDGGFSCIHEALVQKTSSLVKIYRQQTEHSITSHVKVCEQQIIQYAHRKNVFALICSSTRKHINRVNDQGASPLLVAAALGNYDKVEILLYFGARIDQCDREGRTALMLAVMHGHIGLIPVLAQNQDVNQKVDQYEKSALDYALIYSRKHRSTQVLRCVLRYIDDIPLQNSLLPVMMVTRPEDTVLEMRMDSADQVMERIQRVWASAHQQRAWVREPSQSFEQCIRLVNQAVKDISHLKMPLATLLMVPGVRDQIFAKYVSDLHRVDFLEIMRLVRMTDNKKIDIEIEGQVSTIVDRLKFYAHNACEDNTCTKGFAGEVKSVDQKHADEIKICGLGSDQSNVTTQAFANEVKAADQQPEAEAKEHAPDVADEHQAEKRMGGTSSYL